MAIGRPIEQTPNIADKVVTATATAGQTQFTVDGGYRINHLAVFRNGVRLVNGNDYTALDGTTVTLLEDAANLDVLEFQVFDSFSVSDALLTNAASQTVNGDVTVVGTFTVGTGGIGTFVAAEVNVGIVSSNTGITTVKSVQAASSTTTGALQVKGGVGIGKSLYVGGNVSVGGTLTYEDVTNVDSVGLVTAGKGLRVTTGGLVVTAGVSTFAGLTTVTNTAAFHSKQLNVSAGSTFGGAVTLSDTLSVSGTATLTSGISGDLLIPDKLVHTGDTNTAIRFPAADTITAETGGSERLRVTSDGDVLINTTQEFDSLNGRGNLIVGSGSGNEGLTIYSGTGNEGGIIFADGTSGSDAYPGQIQYNHGDNSMRFFTTTGLERLRIDSSGRVMLGTTTEGFTTADDFTISGSGDCGMSIRAGTTSQSIIAMSDATSGAGEYSGYLSYYHSTDELHIGAVSKPIVKIHDEYFNIYANEGTTRFNFGFTDAGGGELSIYDDAGSQKTRICGSTNTDHFFNNGGKVLIGTTTAARLLTLYGDDHIALQNSTTGTGTGNGTHIWVNSSGNGELLIQNRENSDIEFFTNDTERLRISSTGELTQYGMSGNADSAADDLVIGNTSSGVNRGMTIYSHNAQNGCIAFADDGNNFKGAVQYMHNGDRFRFLTGGQETLRLQSGGTDGQCIFYMGGVTNNQNKSGALTLNHYTFNTYNQIDLVRGTSTSGVNKIEIGGSDSSNGSSAATSIQLYTAANATTNNGTLRLKIDASGRLLVGTTVTSSNQSGALNVFGTDGNTSFVSIRRGSNDGSGARFAMCKSRNTTDGAASGLVADNDTIGTIHFYANDGQGFEEGAAIAAAVDGAPGSNDVPTRLTFATTPDGSDTKEEKMRITQDGKLITKNAPDSAFMFQVNESWGLWHTNTGLAPNSTRTWTITGVNYGHGTFRFGGADGNYQRGGCVIEIVGTMWSTAQVYYYNEVLKSSSGASVSVAYNTDNIVVTLASSSNWFYYTASFLQGRRNGSAWATITTG